jgi:hypothetical protein
MASGQLERKRTMKFGPSSFVPFAGTLCVATAAYAEVWLADLAVTVAADNANNRCVFTVTNTHDDTARDVTATLHVLDGNQEVSTISSPDGWTCTEVDEGAIDTVHCDGTAGSARFDLDPTESSTITVNLLPTSSTITCSVQALSRSPDTNMSNNYAVDSD